jgi:hypothetical protein
MRDSVKCLAEAYYIFCVLIILHAKNPNGDLTILSEAILTFGDHHFHFKTCLQTVLLKTHLESILEIIIKSTGLL